MSNFFQRFINLMIGNFLCALGIVITMKANLGFAPWEVFHWGVGNAIGMSIGHASILVSLIISITVVLLREKLGLGTILNLILVGIYIDIFNWNYWTIYYMIKCVIAIYQTNNKWEDSK